MRAKLSKMKNLKQILNETRIFSDLRLDYSINSDAIGIQISLRYWLEYNFFYASRINVHLHYTHFFVETITELLFSYLKFFFG